MKQAHTVSVSTVLLVFVCMNCQWVAGGGGGKQQIQFSLFLSASHSSLIQEACTLYALISNL